MAWLRIKEGADLSLEETETYIVKSIARDPDIWVIEIEDKSGNHPFPGKDR